MSNDVREDWVDDWVDAVTRCIAAPVVLASVGVTAVSVGVFLNGWLAVIGAAVISAAAWWTIERFRFSDSDI